MKKILLNKIDSDSSSSDCCTNDQQNDCVPSLQSLSIPMAGTVEDDAPLLIMTVAWSVELVRRIARLRQFQ